MFRAPGGCPISWSSFLKTNRRVDEHVSPYRIVAWSVVLAVMGLWPRWGLKKLKGQGRARSYMTTNTGACGMS